MREEREKRERKKRETRERREREVPGSHLKLETDPRRLPHRID